MTNIDNIINRSDSFINSDISYDEKKQLADQILRRDGYECKECGRDSDDCNLVIKFREDPDSYENQYDALHTENLETICEDDLLETDDVAAKAESHSETARDKTRLSDIFNTLFIDRSYILLLRKFGYIGGFIGLIILGVLTYGISLGLLYIENTTGVLSSYPLLIMPLATIGFVILYYSEYNTSSYVIKDYNAGKYVFGMLIGSIASIGIGGLLLTEIIELTNYTAMSPDSVITEDSNIFTYAVILLIPIYIGSYSLSRLVENDKTEIILRSLISESQKYNRNIKLNIEQAEKTDHLFGEDIRPIRWKTLGYTVFFISTIAVVPYLGIVTTLFNKIVVALLLFTPAIVNIIYLSYRTYLYNNAKS